jgi:fermentation-respiration switch protein FrsA (DUF1100 family)
MGGAAAAMLMPAMAAAQTVTRRDIAFDAEGTTLRGWLFLPPGAGPHPAVVMAHGFSAVKEQYLDRYATVFAAAGIAAVVFDNRCFGASDGTPRQEIDPVAQLRDYGHAVTWAGLQPEIDARRIGAWGTSYSGGHVLLLGATDRRVRCVVAQVPHISGPAASAGRMPSEALAALHARFAADRAARYQGRAPAMLPAVAETPTSPGAMRGPGAWSYFNDSRAFAPAWRNEITLRSIEYSLAYEPGVAVSRIGPTPLLMLVAQEDMLTPTALAVDAFERAQHPKRLVMLPGGHFDAYVAQFEASSSAARDWFVQHLGA